jgi:hypothetical protein
MIEDLIGRGLLALLGDHELLLLLLAVLHKLL